MTRISFAVNRTLVTVEADPARSLLDVLRDDLGLTGAKQGCDHEGECGACTVLLEGLPVRSCLMPVGKVAGRHVETVEGLAGPQGLHPLQAAFIECGAVQCGYCTPGMLMAAKALLDRETDPTDAQIIEALEGNLCRCTGYVKIVDAVRLAAARLRGEAKHAAGSSGRVQGESSSLNLRPSPPHPVIGCDPLRIDSVPKVTGAALYVEDMTMPGLLHGAVLRSPYHHARLRALDPDLATRVPGVMAVLTARDLPGANALGDYSQEEPVLTPLGATLRMVGAPVALVVAATPEAANTGLDAIGVDYEVLPHVFEPEDALQPGAPYVAGRDNVLTTYEVRHGDLDEAFGASAVIVQEEYRTAFLEHSALERESVLGYYDEAGRLTLTGGTHEPFFPQRYIADALALPPEQVRVIVPPTGGSFGGKQDPWPFVATALMVHQTRRPVRLVYSRQESFDASPKRHPYVIRGKVGATGDGRLTGIRMRMDCNTGAYDAHGQYIPNYAVTASGGPYRWQAVDAYAQTVYTNGPKAGQYRGFGTAQAAFGTECMLDELAQRLGLDPLELRLRNSLQAGEPSFLGYPVGESLGFIQVLEAIRPQYQAYLADADAFNNGGTGGVRQAVPGPEWDAAGMTDTPTSRRRRRGVGLAGMWYRFGKSGSLQVQADAELATNGRFIIYCTAVDYGQGTNTVMSQIAAEALGVARERIDVVNGDTALVPDSGIQGASRATYFVGGAVRAAAANLRVEVLGLTAEMLDRNPASLCLRSDRVASGDGPSAALAEVAAEFDRIGKPRRVRGVFDLSDRFPIASRPDYLPLFVAGAHLAEVEVDLHTGQTRVLRMAAAHDLGRVVNPVDAAGQIEGAVLMGVGAALMEEVVAGHATGFATYCVPTAKSMPQIEVILVEVPGLLGPFGVKGLGEAAMLPATPAIVNAMSRAIGRRLRRIPATPERVLAALRDV